MRRDFPREVKRADHATSDALLTEAVKALEPFAALAASVDGSPYTSPFGDSCPLSVIPSAEPNSGTASLGDCRRARATLSKIKAADEGRAAERRR